MQGFVYAFINFEQAARFGHVGWGFQLDEHTFSFGSTDHLYRHNAWDLPAWIRYMAVPPGGDIDWWNETGSHDEMLATMRSGVHEPTRSRHIFYHAYKVLPVQTADPSRAASRAREQRQGGWSVLENNCVHHAYQIFSEYGAGHIVPDPCTSQTLLIPKAWFASFRGAVVGL